MSIIISDNIVITFQEKDGDAFDIIRERLNSENSIIRNKSVDYLFYRLLDITVDIYFDILEKMGDYIELIENEVLSKPDNNVLIKIQNNKNKTGKPKPFQKKNNNPK